MKPALMRYERIAEQGFAKARYWCGVYYFEGKGTEINRGKAKKWWRKAEDQEIEPAKESLRKYF